MAPAAPARETAGTTICLIVRYVRHHAGDEGVARLLTLAGDDRPLEVLENEQHWSTYEQKIALLEAAAVVLDDPDVAIHIGETALDHSVGPGIRILLAPARITAHGPRERVEGGAQVLDRDRHVRRARRPRLRRHPLPHARPQGTAPRRLPAQHRLHPHDRATVRHAAAARRPPGVPGPRRAGVRVRRALDQGARWPPSPRPGAARTRSTRSKRSSPSCSRRRRTWSPPTTSTRCSAGS